MVISEAPNLSFPVSILVAYFASTGDELTIILSYILILSPVLPFPLDLAISKSFSCISLTDRETGSTILLGLDTRMFSAREPRSPILWNMDVTSSLLFPETSTIAFRIYLSDIPLSIPS